MSDNRQFIMLSLLLIVINQRGEAWHSLHLLQSNIYFEWRAVYEICNEQDGSNCMSVVINNRPRRI